MWKFLKKLAGVDESPPEPRAVDPAQVVDEALAIQSTQDIGTATAALEEHGTAVVGEVARRLERAELTGAPKIAAAIWLAHHVTHECAPALDEALIDALDEALSRDLFGIMLPASVDAVSKLPPDRRDAIAARAFAAAGRSDQKYRLVKISRTDAMMEAVNEALAELEDLRIALAETAFRTSFDAHDVELLLRHYPAEEPYASPYVVAFGAIRDARFVPALVTALQSNYTRVRDAARRGLHKMQDVAEDAVLELLTASRKAQRLGAAAVLEKWEINDRVRGAIQRALRQEKVADVVEALQPLAPLEGEVNFRSMLTLREQIPAEDRERIADAVRRRLDGEQIDWTPRDGEAFVTIVAWELEGAPTGVDRCMEVLDEALSAAPDNALAPWASAWFARSIRSLYSKGRPLPWAAWEKSHLRFGEAGLQPIVDLLIDHRVDGDEELREFALCDYQPCEQHARLLTHTYGDAHMAVAEAMRNAPAEMVEVVAPLLSDSRKEVRQAAAVALGAIGDPSAEPLLKARLKKERAKDAKQAIEAALTQFRMEALTDGAGTLADLEPNAENHARIDRQFAAIDARPKFDVESLPALRWSSGAELSDGAYRWLISMLEQCDYDVPSPELESLRHHLDPVSSKHVLEALHGAFDEDHREVRIGWVLFGSVVLGNDDQIASLGSGLDEMARFASSEQAFRRLQVLERHGSNAAIGWLDHWSRRAKSRGLKERSHAALRRLAHRRGVSPDDLADIVFGDFGLDQNGERVFVVGDREIRTKFDTTGEVGVLKDDGKLTTRFPSERVDDDPTEYERVRDEYRAWRKALKRALRGQIDRLEWSMVWGRTWDRETLLDTWGRHPVLRELAHSILWLAHHDGAKTVVRLDDDFTFATVDEEPLDAEIDAVSVAHPVHFADGDAEAWHQLFVDYMLVPPFPQLDRPTHPIPDAEGDELKFEEVDSAPMRDRLQNAGWQRDYVEDGGMVYHLYRDHPNGITALVELDPGMYVARDAYDDSQRVTVRFARDHETSPVADVPRCLVAEVCWEVAG